MTTYIFTGHLGGGKTLCAVDFAREYLGRGCKVAGNITLNLDHMMPPRCKLTYLKLPGVPDPEHLEMIGRGYEGSYDESKHGLLILDECGTWLNSRDWSDKKRRGLFQWITHARKFGWDVVLIIQDYESLDKQIRASVSEMVAKCIRLDRIKIPFLPIKLPRAHLATFRYLSPSGPVTRRKLTRGNELFSAYDTRERIHADINIDDSGEIIDARAVYTALSPWHLKGRYMKTVRPIAVLGFVLKFALLAVFYPVCLAYRIRPKFPRLEELAV